MTKIIFACDYKGIELKNQLYAYATGLNYEIKDIGIEFGSKVDYIDITKDLVNELNSSDSIGVIVCGSGQGVAMVANRSSNMRAAVCRNTSEAEDARRKLNANILCLGSKQTTIQEAIKCLETFISTEFKSGKHDECVKKLSIKATENIYNGVNIIVRAIITCDNHVLMSTPTSTNLNFSSDLYFLPSGHVDYNESVNDAIKREIYEEMDIVVGSFDFLGILECSWPRNGNIYHEINVIYRVTLPNITLDSPPTSTESAIKFVWCDLAKIDNYKILPEKLLPFIKQTTQLGYSTNALLLSKMNSK